MVVGEDGSGKTASDAHSVQEQKKRFRMIRNTLEGSEFHLVILIAIFLPFAGSGSGCTSPTKAHSSHSRMHAVCSVCPVLKRNGDRTEAIRFDHVTILRARAVGSK